MDSLDSSLPAPKTRRKHSPAFKEMIIKACNEPGSSTEAVAQKYQLNANLIHKWRRDFERPSAEDFIPLPAPVAPVSEQLPDRTIRIELSGGVVVHWPADRIMDSALWLKVVQS